MKKSGLHIHLTNRAAYTLIAILVLAIVGVGVYAIAPMTSQNVDGAVFGHTWQELGNLPSDFIDGDINWNELSGIPAGFSDGAISWGEVSGIPAGFSDGIDNTGSGGLVSCRVRIDRSSSNSAPSPNEGYSGYSSGNSEQCTPFTTISSNPTLGGPTNYNLMRICIQCQ